MAFPSVTYTFSNSTTADATQVNQNFQDLVDGLSNGTKDLSISALTVAGNASFSGTVTLGNATADDITFTGSLASTIPIKTTNSFNIGSATLGLAGIYFGQSGGANTSRIVASVVASDLTHTLPARTGTLALYVAPTIQTFTSGSGTYTLPAGCRWIRVRMVGGGGGGSGSGTASGGNGSAGGNTTFGGHTANGGSGGTYGGAGGAGGSYTLGAGGAGITMTGSPGAAGGAAAASGYRFAGGVGGGSPFFGGGAATSDYNNSGSNGNTNSGGGGQGGGNTATTNSIAGSGGGAGGGLDIAITSPSSTYSYAVGAAGALGSAGTSGANGGSGAAGYIEVTEYYG